MTTILRMHDEPWSTETLSVVHINAPNKVQEIVKIGNVHLINYMHIKTCII